MQKVRQNDLKFSENQFFVFEMLIYFFVKETLRAILLFKNDWTRYPIGVFKKTSTVSYTSSLNDRKNVKKAKL